MVWCDVVVPFDGICRTRARKTSTTNKNTYKRHTNGTSIENYVCLLFYRALFLYNFRNFCHRPSNMSLFFFLFKHFGALYRFQIVQERRRNRMKTFSFHFCPEHRKSSKNKLQSAKTKRNRDRTRENSTVRTTRKYNGAPHN